MHEAAAAIRRARHVYLTGIGASWNAALSVGTMFYSAGKPVYLLDAAELLHFATIPPDALIIVLSRSGRSVEIVRLMAKARKGKAIVVGLTNAIDGPLARESHFSLLIPVAFDHAISVNTYSTLALAAAALARTTLVPFDNAFASSLAGALRATATAIPIWQDQMEKSDWLVPNASYYFLARGSSLGSCHEARLLWEEGAKSPATCMGTGMFRHGPQEIVREGSRFGVWIDSSRMRGEDLAVVRDLRRLGASVMIVGQGQGLPQNEGILVFRIPEMPAEWQFLADTIPAQLAAERLSRLSQVDCDSFRVCSYVVEGEYGLLPDTVKTADDGDL